MDSRIPVVVMTRIAKSFGAVQALKGVDLVLYQGEIVGLVGDNGAGKSTLMKILTGAEQPDSGEIRVMDRLVRFRSPRDSRAMGIEMIYQDLALADNLSVVENIFLGRELRKGFFLDEARMDTAALDCLTSLSVPIPNVRVPVEYLSGGQRQSVAVARAIAFGAKVVIMDEPTAALAVRETQRVLRIARSLRDNGVAVVLISHRLQDVIETADRIVVLSRGQKVAELPAAKASISRIVELMVGEGVRAS